MKQALYTRFNLFSLLLCRCGCLSNPTSALNGVNDALALVQVPMNGQHHDMAQAGTPVGKMVSAPSDMGGGPNGRKPPAPSENRKQWPWPEDVANRADKIANDAHDASEDIKKLIVRSEDSASKATTDAITSITKTVQNVLSHVDKQVAKTNVAVRNASAELLKVARYVSKAPSLFDVRNKSVLEALNQTLEVMLVTMGPVGFALNASIENIVSSIQYAGFLFLAKSENRTMHSAIKPLDGYLQHIQTAAQLTGPQDEKIPMDKKLQQISKKLKDGAAILNQQFNESVTNAFEELAFHLTQTVWNSLNVDDRKKVDRTMIQMDKDVKVVLSRIINAGNTLSDTYDKTCELTYPGALSATVRFRLNFFLIAIGICTWWI